jgi:hypothetical protein
MRTGGLVVCAQSAVRVGIRIMTGPKTVDAVRGVPNIAITLITSLDAHARPVEKQSISAAKKTVRNAQGVVAQQGAVTLILADMTPGSVPRAIQPVLLSAVLQVNTMQATTYEENFK